LITICFYLIIVGCGPVYPALFYGGLQPARNKKALLYRQTYNQKGWTMAAPNAEIKTRENTFVAGRRRALGFIVAGSALLTIPNRWFKPVVDSVLIPAHAQLSSCGGTPLGQQVISDTETSVDVTVPAGAACVRITAIGGQGGGGGGGGSGYAPYGGGGGQGGGGGGASVVLRSGSVIAGANGGEGGSGGDGGDSGADGSDGSPGAIPAAATFIVSVKPGELLSVVAGLGGVGGGGGGGAGGPGGGGADGGDGGGGSGGGSTSGFGEFTTTDIGGAASSGGSGGMAGTTYSGISAIGGGCPPSDSSGGGNAPGLGACRDGAAGMRGMISGFRSGIGGTGGAPGSVTLEWFS
jgi:hypothetical protein